MSTNYVPVFNPTVTLDYGETPVYAVAGIYCLTMQSAIALAQLPEIFPLVTKIGLGDPFPVVGVSGYDFSQQVPFFTLKGGANINAAYVAQPFGHGYPYATEVGQALGVINPTIQQYVAGTYDNPPIVNATPVPSPMPIPPPPPPLPVPVVSPVGAVEDATSSPVKYQNLAGTPSQPGTTTFPIGSVTGQNGVPADSRGTFTEQGDQTPFGISAWWTLN